jgi:hypothetical protein
MSFSLITIATFVVAIPFLVGVARYSQLPTAGKWLTGLMGIWLLVEIAAYILRIQSINNWFLYMLLSFFELAIITMFYTHIFKRERAKTIVIVVEFWLLQEPANTLGILYESLFIISMGLYALYEWIVQHTSGTYNLVNIVMITFFLGSGVYFASTQFLLESNKGLFMLAMKAHAYLLLICYSLFAFGLWRLRGSLS